MQDISCEDMAAHKTWITDFICDKSKHEKTFAELEIIFEECLGDLTPENDSSNDLRIIELQDKMSSGKWTGNIDLERNNSTGVIEEGIHRGVAYLRCVKSGISIDKLPKLCVLDR